MAFKPVLPPTTKGAKSRSVTASSLTQFEHALRSNFQISTWLLIGALIQSVLIFLVPRIYALYPVALLLFARFANTLLITYGLKRNHYLEGVVHERVSAQVPDEDGNFTDQGSDQKVVCFLLGAKSNHPMGIFAPKLNILGDYLTKMIATLDADKGLNGFLGASSFTSLDKNAGTEFLSVSYWRSVEDIHKFAYGPLHREAWEWYNKLPNSQQQYIGINHELFAADKGQWEGVYKHFQPTLLGATTFLRKGDEMIGGTVPDQYIGSLMDASRGKLKSSAGRLGWQPEKLYEKYQYQADEKY